MTIVGSRRTCTFFKVKGEVGLKNPESKRTIHLQAGHVVTDQHFTDWKVKGRRCSNPSNSRYERLRNDLGR